MRSRPSGSAAGNCRSRSAHSSRAPSRTRQRHGWVFSADGARIASRAAVSSAAASSPGMMELAAIMAGPPERLSVPPACGGVRHSCRGGSPVRSGSRGPMSWAVWDEGPCARGRYAPVETKDDPCLPARRPRGGPPRPARPAAGRAATSRSSASPARRRRRPGASRRCGRTWRCSTPGCPTAAASTCAATSASVDPSIKGLILTSYEDDEALFAAIMAGAAGLRAQADPRHRPGRRRPPGRRRAVAARPGGHPAGAGAHPQRRGAAARAASRSPSRSAGSWSTSPRG